MQSARRLQSWLRFVVEFDVPQKLVTEEFPMSFRHHDPARCRDRGIRLRGEAEDSLLSVGLPRSIFPGRSSRQY